MRILWVKVGGLWPLNTGGRLRTFHIISELSRRHRVILLTTHGPGDDPEELAVQLPWCKQILSVPYAIPKQGSAAFATLLLRSWLSPLPLDLLKFRVPSLCEKVRQLVETREVDLCVADFLSATPNVPIESPVPVVLFSHNVEFMIWKRLANIENSPLRRALLEFEWRKMRRYEAQACDRASLVVAVSDVDRGLLAANAHKADICTIPTGVDTSYFIPNGWQEAPWTLVFTGSMDWYPNEDAVLYFVESILPLIRRELTEVSFVVVGRNPAPRLCAVAAEAGIRVTGTVDDVRPYIGEAAVYVVPLRVGGGTRLKIFEALAMGKAVVSTSVGAEGLPIISGEHFLQVDTPADFARAVVSLLQDSGRRKSLGAVGRRLVEERYSWPQVACEFEARCKEVVAHHAR